MKSTKSTKSTILRSHFYYRGKKALKGKQEDISPILKNPQKKRAFAASGAYVTQNA